MRRTMNGIGVFKRVLSRRKQEREMSRGLMGLLVVAGALGMLVFLRELPNLRRYIRIESM